MFAIVPWVTPPQSKVNVSVHMLVAVGCTWGSVVANIPSKIASINAPYNVSGNYTMSTPPRYVIEIFKAEPWKASEAKIEYSQCCIRHCDRMEELQFQSPKHLPNWTYCPKYSWNTRNTKCNMEISDVSSIDAVFAISWKPKILWNHHKNVPSIKKVVFQYDSNSSDFICKYLSNIADINSIYFTPWCNTNSTSIDYYTRHGPQKPTFLEVFMVNNLVFRWPKSLYFSIGFLGSKNGVLYLPVTHTKHLKSSHQVLSWSTWGMPLWTASATSSRTTTPQELRRDGMQRPPKCQ